MKFRSVVLLGLLLSIPALADEPPASADSIRALMAITRSHQLLDSLKAQVDGSMKAAMSASTGEAKLDPKQQAVLDDMRAKMLATFDNELTWDILEPMMIEIYTKNFSQRDVDGMLAFYKSDVGAAVINKMPGVMQQSMQVMQVRMAALAPKIRRIGEDAAAQIKALEAEKTRATGKSK